MEELGRLLAPVDIDDAAIVELLEPGGKEEAFLVFPAINKPSAVLALEEDNNLLILLQLLLSNKVSPEELGAITEETRDAAEEVVVVVDAGAILPPCPLEPHVAAENTPLTRPPEEVPPPPPGLSVGTARKLLLLDLFPLPLPLDEEPLGLALWDLFNLDEDAPPTLDFLDPPPDPPGLEDNRSLPSSLEVVGPPNFLNQDAKESFPIPGDEAPPSSMEGDGNPSPAPGGMA